MRQLKGKGVKEQPSSQGQNGLRHSLALCFTPGLQLASKPPWRLCQLPSPRPTCLPSPPSLEAQIWEQDSCPGAGWPQPARERLRSPGPAENHLLIWDGCHRGREADPCARSPLPLQLLVCGRVKMHNHRNGDKDDCSLQMNTNDRTGCLHTMGVHTTLTGVILTVTLPGSF